MTSWRKGAEGASTRASATRGRISPSETPASSWRAVEVAALVQADLRR